MEYTIIKSSDPYSLSRSVQHAISEGWVPLGGPFAADSATEHSYSGDRLTTTRTRRDIAQAMVRELPDAQTQASDE